LARLRDLTLEVRALLDGRGDTKGY
jgi:hypothetical protein